MTIIGSGTAPPAERRREAWIIDGVRSPIGRLGGALGPVRADDLAAHVISQLMIRVQRSVPDFPPSEIADVILGCANQAGEDNRNVARMAALLAGLPVSVPGETVNRLCASGLSAIAAAARAIRTGEGHVFIAGGVESMTRAPFVLAKGGVPFDRDIRLFDTSLGWRFVNPRLEAMYGTHSMGETAENVASHYRIARHDQDAFAVRSQSKAARARDSGRFAREIVPVSIPQAKGDDMVVSNDEFLRPDTTLEALARLRPAFRHDGEGSVTAGNSSGLNDGAGVLLLASDEAVEKYGFTPVARVVASAAVGVEPRNMGMGPVPSTRMVLERSGLTLDDMDVIELNEAFAAQSLACMRELGLTDDDPRVNPNGGAIALGHPLGMSGARLALSAVRELQLTGGRHGLCAMCIGVGQGFAMVLERV